MKESKYNFIFKFKDEKNKYLIYNSISNALATLDETHYVKYNKFCKDNNPDILGESFVEKLINNGFLIDYKYDELKVLEHQVYMKKYDKENLSITIAPTSDCNFRCIYCYEKDVLEQNYMGQETQDALVKFIENQVECIKRLNVTWYGGEPLLAMNIIESLSNSIIGLCEKNKIQYQASMVTNGYLIDSRAVELMESCRISDIQVTLDGTQNIHDKRRPLKNNGKTFDKILDNIQEYYEQLPVITIRINIDKENFEGAYEIVDIIKGKGWQEKVRPYIAAVDNANECYSKNICLGLSELCKEDIKFEEYVRKVLQQDNAMMEYPRMKYSACGADVLNNYVIDATGEMYKCWSDIGVKDTSIANVKDAIWHFSESYFDYMLHNPLHDEKCGGCKLLPLCMGGCPHKRIHQYAEQCCKEKYNLQDYVKRTAEQIVNYKLENA